MSTLGSVSSGVRKKLENKLVVSDANETTSLRDINWRNFSCIKKHLYKTTPYEQSELLEMHQDEIYEILFDQYKPTEIKSFGNYVCGTVEGAHPDANLGKHLNAIEDAGTSKRKLVDAMVLLLHDVARIESDAL